MRFRTDMRGFGVAKLFFTLTASADLDLSTGTSFFIVRGSFLGRPSLDPFPTMVAPAVFVAGIVMLTWGSTWLFGVGIGA